MTTSPVCADRPDRGNHLFEALDGLRGIAALFVVAAHAGPMFMGAVNPGSSGVAVDFFFILSGFVIPHAYEGRLKAGRSAGWFVKVRFARFFPLFVLGASLGLSWFVVRWLLSGEWGLGPFSFGQFLMLPDPSNLLLFPFNPPAWSLFAEFLVNIIYVLIWRRLSLPVLAVIIAVGALGVAIAAPLYGTLDIGFYWVQLPGVIARVTFGFFVGVALYRLYAAGHRAPAVAAPWYFLLLAAVLSLRVPEGFRALYDAAGVLVIAPLIVWCASSARLAGLTLDFARAAGAVSYAVYILHYPVLEYAESLDVHLLGRRLAAVAPVSGLVLAALVAGAASLADRIYDRPVRRFITRRLRLS